MNEKGHNLGEGVSEMEWKGMSRIVDLQGVGKM